MIFYLFSFVIFICKFHVFYELVNYYVNLISKIIDIMKIFYGSSQILNLLNIFLPVIVL